MLENLTTEIRNDRTSNLDQLSVDEFLKIMNEEDQKVALAVREQIPMISKVVQLVVEAFQNGGRLIYTGAGTSGRIGLLDAVECPPTFGTNPSEVVGLIAGGERAFIKAVEGAEDSEELGKEDLLRISLTKNDIVIGIAASGRTPYVIGALKYANEIGAKTVAVACNKGSKIGEVAFQKIEVDNGPEVLTGSTRLKAGTSQKLICNMISTASMIGIGKVYKNLMVDLQLTNIKLVDRAKRIIVEATGCDYETASNYLMKANNQTKVAIVMILTGMNYDEAMISLNKACGFISKVVKN
ncbi:N-acetylmuramic acid 6-phosphate etherase [Gottfriedia acidiceleris]|uniref:N-acetylmuramic acid 6-phosphate etherase n=1 Tax=Bacillaceae TaxID=186817 RepID=UPI000BEDADAA|nr:MULTISPECIES: N-acetylmuramic acid 6-phosphate etherase [unclassified Bacillus (in: firmicutes)]PEC48247.1 N-acetylmuramic acid 6-phosphate etherase [Bacillus sp. AFS096315]PFM83486.1 N-acetylmuramic acid 6-phosphate etherase [Bacillus sp. AFS077874]